MMCCQKALKSAALIFTFKLLSLPALGQDGQVVGGPLPTTPADKSSVEIDWLHPNSRANARQLGLRSANQPQAPDRSVAMTYNFPMRVKQSAAAAVATPLSVNNFVDLDAATTVLGDWACGQRTYDGHRGIDFGVGPFSWWRMANFETDIVAAAPGVIVNKRDGQSDRTCGTLTTLPGGLLANYVAVQHNDGMTSYYLHMKTGTVTTKAIGAQVEAGEKLGNVGSSGFSTGPHLHFELRDTNGIAVDPFAGACGATRSLWKHQWNASDDFRITQTATFGAAPTFASNCTSNTQVDTDVPSFQDTFLPSQIVRAAVFLRDQSPGDVASIQIFDPSGTQMLNTSTGTPSAGSFFRSSYWFTTYTLPAGAPSGAWRVRGATGPNDVVEHTFYVGSAPASTSLVGAVLPGGRSITRSSTATVFATILNTTATPARGCSIHPQTPLSTGFTFQTTDPTTNALTGSPNKSVDIPGNSAQTFVLAFNPFPTAEKAEAVTTVLRMTCSNGGAAPIFDGVNTLLMSFDPNPVPDIIPIAATVSNDGVLRLAGTGQTGFWAAASVNIGVGAPLNVSPEVSSGTAVTATLCETNPATGQCLASPTTSVTTQFDPNVTHTFSIFASASSAVPFNPAGSRILLNFKDAAGIVRGQTSVAVSTN